MSERDWIFNNASASDSKMMDISATQSVMLTAQDILQWIAMYDYIVCTENLLLDDDLTTDENQRA